MSAPLQPRPNPYVGPRPFQYGEPLFGRDREAMELLDLLIAERIVLLYSPSGAGKTSLMQAALIPELEKEGFQVLPVMRVSLEPPPELARSAIANRYVLSLLLSLEETLPAAQQMPLAELAGMELVEYLERRSLGADESEPLVLIFDQFEEILTVDPTDRAAKEVFFAQVGAALRQQQRWALFAMREEYPAGLDPYLRPLPTRLSTTFRLELLEEAAARLAMEQPARQVGVDFTDAAARQLVNDLRRVRVQRPDGTTEEQPGLYVEPVQLQVVCRRLWEKLPADATQISEEDVAAVGDVDSALSGYYAERVAAIAGQTGVRERAIREWCDRHLITQQGIRGQVLQGHEESEGLENLAIAPMVDAHLVRAEKRRGATWFELAHDRLIEPVRQNNAAWFQANLSALQRQAALWEEQHRSPGLLLRGEALEEAERWADTHEDELTSTERDFLAACREARAMAERERRQARRIRWLAIGASIIGAIAIMAFVVATYQFWKVRRAEMIAQVAAVNAEARRVEAERLLTVSIAQALAAQAPRQHELDQDERGALLARQAYLFNQQSHGHVLAQVDDALRTVLSVPYFGQILPSHKQRVVAVAFSPDGKTLASGSGGTVRLWTVGQPGTAPVVLPGHEREVVAVAFSPDGKTLASGSDNGTVRLWTVDQPEMAPVILPGHGQSVVAVAFSPDGKTLASGGGDSTVRLWTVDQPEMAPVILPGHGQSVFAVAFSPDGKTLASGGGDSTVQLWAVGQPGTAPVVLPGHEREVVAVAFSPDGKTLASGSDNGTVRLWTVDQPEMAPVILPGYGQGVFAVAFSPDGKTLASGGDGSTVRLWAVGQPGTTPVILPGHEQGVFAVAFSPDGKILASGSNDTVRLWAVGQPETTPVILPGHGQRVFAVAFSPDGKTLASGGGDSTVRLWAVGQPGTAPVVLGHEQGGFTITLSPEGEIVASGGVVAVAFSPDGKTLASGSDNGAVRLWTVDQPEMAPVILPGHGQRVFAVAFSPDGKTLASGGSDSTVRLWAVGQPETAPVVLPVHERGVFVAAFSPDGKTLASGGSDSTVRLWAVGQPETAPVVLPVHERGVFAVAFSPDGKTLASGSDNGTVRLWAVGQPGTAPVVLPGHEQRVLSVAFSPDGKTLASGSGDSTVRLWAVGQPGTAPVVLPGHKQRVVAVAFSPDGKTLASGSGDGTIRIWIGQTEILADRACEKVWRNLTRDEWHRFVGTDIPYERTCLNLPIHPSFMEAGRKLARSGDVDGAMAIFQRALVLEPGFNVDPKAEAKAWAAQALIEKGQQLLKQDKVKEALAAYGEAQTLDPKRKSFAENWNTLCLDGSLSGHAAEVMHACEQAVTLEPADGGTRDTRGLARALTGNVDGAIADFQAFIAWAEDKEGYEQYRPQRQRWIDDLRAGKNPFTPEEIEELRKQ